MKNRTSAQNSGVAGGSSSNCDIMTLGSPDITGAGEPPETAEECSGKKKSKFQTFKNLFVKKKRKDSPPPLGENVLKSSQSSDDIIKTRDPPTARTVKDEEQRSKNNMGNKAMSHDSVFVSDSSSSESNEVWARASQDSVCGKVKSLQCADWTQRGGCLSVEASESEDDQMSYESSSRPATPQAPVPADFSLPASSISCLDSSAARHRITVNTKACAKRKPVSRKMLEIKRRNLREKLLLRDTEEKLRMVSSVVEEECEHLPGEQGHDSDRETHKSNRTSITSQHKDEDVPDSVTNISQTSPNSSISAGNSYEEDEDHVHKSEVLESRWKSPVALELQANDFLLETGSDVIPEDQGSLLEEVLSSLKNPLVSGLAVERESQDLEIEAADVNHESVDVQLEEEASKGLLGLSDLFVTTKKQLPLSDSSSESTVQSEETTEEILEEEKLLEMPESAKEESAAACLQVSEANVKREVDQTENAKEEEGKTAIQEMFEKTDTSEALPVNVEEKDEDRLEEHIVEDKAELENETKGDESEKISDLIVVELEKREDAFDVEEHQEPEGQAGPSEPERNEYPDFSYTIEISDETQACGLPAEQTAEVEVTPPTVSLNLNCPTVHSPFSNTSVDPLEEEEESEPSQLHVSCGPQEVSSEKLEVVSKQQKVLEAPVGQPTTTSEVQPQFPIRAEMSHVQEESVPESPFGVRLRKTALLHRYGLDGEVSWSPTQTGTLEALGAPNIDQNGKKTVLPKRLDLLVKTVSSGRKVSDTVDRICDDPSWISVARQMQRNFPENSPEVPHEKHSSQEDLKRPDSLLGSSNSIAQNRLAQSCSTIKVSCSLEISNTSMMEKESLRAAGPSTAPLAQDEPPWMALAKKKAKAWSEMPQTVQ